MPFNRPHQQQSIQTKQHFTIYWIDGKREVIRGLDFDNALHNAGYTPKVKIAIWKSEKGITTTYTWDEVLFKWY